MKFSGLKFNATNSNDACNILYIGTERIEEFEFVTCFLDPDDVNIRISFNKMINLKKFEFTNEQLNNIDLNSFQSLTNLEDLKFNADDYKYKGIFNNLTKLKKLTIGYQFYLDKYLFKSLVNLEHLELDSVEGLCGKHFSNLNRVKYLKISGQHYTDCDFKIKWLKHMQNLETLKLQKFYFVMTQFKIFPKLRELELSEGILEQLNGLEGLFHLQSLKLSSIRIREIGNKTFDDLQALVHLDLRHNQLEKLGVHLLDNLVNLVVLGKSPSS